MRVNVSDHAVLRYMERVQGLPVEKVREHIKNLVAKHPGACAIKAEGMRFIIKDDTVCTVTPVQFLNERRVPR